MLCANSYTKDYIEACRAMLDKQVAAYEHLAAAAGGAQEPAVEEFEPQFFGNLILVLESYFVHRARGREGKDGNPLNEVRMLSASLMNHDRRLLADKTIKYTPERSVLRIKIGEEIRVGVAGFKSLYSAFLAEIEGKY
jgi:hypothetical protein